MPSAPMRSTETSQTHLQCLTVPLPTAQLLRLPSCGLTSAVAADWQLLVVRLWGGVQDRDRLPRWRVERAEL